VELEGRLESGGLKRMKSSKNEWLEGFWFGWSAAMAGGVVAIIIILILIDMGV